MRIFIICAAVFFLGVNATVCAQEAGRAKDKLVTEAGSVSIGMTEKDLHRTAALMKGAEKWLTYRIMYAEAPTEFFTFHMKDGRVDGWKTGDIEGYINQ
jgi:hypothetical protein